MSKKALEAAHRLLLNAPYDRSGADEEWLLVNIVAALAAAREQGRAEAFNEIAKWHDARYKEAAVMAETNGISGAHAAAHYAALEYCRSRSHKENEK